MNLTLMDLHLLAGGDYVKSTEYSSELLRKNWEIWEVLAWRTAICPMGKLELSFRRARTSDIFEIFLSNSELYSIDFT